MIPAPRNTLVLAALASLIVQGGAADTQSSVPAFVVGPSLTALMGRSRHSATVLRDGGVWLAGGETQGVRALASTELLLAGSTLVVPTGPLETARRGHTATLLVDGRVLITGGEAGTTGPGPAVLRSAEIYDPVTKTCRAIASMTKPRTAHSATRLPDGRVLIAGGLTTSGSGIAVDDSAEIFDPGTGSFQIAGRFSRAAVRSATLLTDGRVLFVSASTAEVFDPGSGAFIATGAPASTHEGHTATRLADGRVLIAGGLGSRFEEIYDPSTGTFRGVGALVTSRVNHEAALLPDGRVLVVGGRQVQDASGARTPGQSLQTTEVFDPASSRFSSGPPLLVRRVNNSVTLLPDAVWVVGGTVDRRGEFLWLPRPRVPSGSLAETIRSVIGRWDAFQLTSATPYEFARSWLPESGVRFVYAGLQRLLGVGALETLTGVAPFLSGPHGLLPNFTTHTDFGRYNPDFVVAVRQALEAALADRGTAEIARVLYDARLRQQARLYYLAYHAVRNNPNRQSLIDAYLQAVADGARCDTVPAMQRMTCSPPSVVRAGMASFANAMTLAGYDGPETNVAPGFWIRRAIDGTDDEFVALLTTVMQRLDPGFLNSPH